jgi:hypothetical protein
MNDNDGGTRRRLTLVAIRDLFQVPRRRPSVGRGDRDLLRFKDVSFHSFFDACCLPVACLLPACCLSARCLC